MSRKPKRNFKPVKPPKGDEAHRHCVSKGWMQMSYSRSFDYELCDSDGTYNPVGRFVRTKRTGEVREVRGQCSWELLDDGRPNPDWEGCPYGDTKENVLPVPDEQRIMSLVDDEVEPEPSSEIDEALARLDALLNKVGK